MFGQGIKALMQKDKENKSAKTETKTEEATATATKTENKPSVIKANKNQVVIVDRDHSRALMAITLPKGFVGKKGKDHPDANTQSTSLGGSTRSLAQLMRFLRYKETRIKFIQALDKRVASKLFELMYSEYENLTFNHDNFNEYIAAWNEVYPKNSCAKVDDLKKKSTKVKAKKADKNKKAKKTSKKLEKNTQVKTKKSEQSNDYTPSFKELQELVKGLDKDQKAKVLAKYLP